MILLAVAAAAVALLFGNSYFARGVSRPAAPATAGGDDARTLVGAPSERYREADVDWVFAAAAGEMPALEPLRSLLDASDRRVLLSSAAAKLAAASFGDAMVWPATAEPERRRWQTGAGALVLIGADMASADVAAVEQEILDVKLAAPADYVIVTPRWSPRSSWATPSQQDAAKRWIDTGADLVIGSGSSALQEVQRYRSKWIVYSLGDLNVPFGGSAPYRLLARLTIKPDGARIVRVYPLADDATAPAPRLRPVTAKEFGDVYWRLVTEQWAPDDTRLKRWLSVGRDRFGRYLRLGKDV